MSAKGIEKNVVDRIYADLKNIDGTGNYYNNIPDANIFDEFKAIDQLTNFPNLCIGRVSYGVALERRRTDFELPMEIEIWGRVQDINNPIDSALKLLSDIRIAIGSDAELNSQVTELAFSGVVGAMEGLGEVLFTVTCHAHYET